MARVALIGDSHAEGLGWVLGDRLAERGHQLVYLGDHRGWSTRQLLDSGEIEAAAAENPDVILVSSGHNDDGPAVEQALYAAMGRLKSTGARVGWVLSGPSTRADVEARHLRNRALVLRRLPLSFSLIDGRRMIKASDLSGDGVHLSRAGYDRWAQQIATRVPWVGRGVLVATTAALGGVVAGYSGARFVRG